MRKLKLEKPDEVVNEITNIFYKNDLARFIHRLNAILYVAAGHDCYETAAVFNHSPRTIHSWVKAVNEHGLYALQDEPHPGRPSRITPEIKKILRRDLAESPLGMGYESPRWDGKLLMKHLKKRYRIELKLRRCQMLLQELSSPDTFPHASKPPNIKEQ